MLNKTTLGAALLLATVAASSSAFAGDRDFNTAAGAIVGAAIGSNSGPNGVLVGGLVGAAVGNSLSSGHGHARVVVGAPAYYAPAPTYYAAPAPVYYAPPPAYYPAPQPVYYSAPPAYYGGPVVVRPGYYHHGYHGHRGGYR